MNKEKTVETEMHIDGDKIRIETAIPLAARIFGLPFLAMGAYVAYNLAMSIAGVMRVRARRTKCSAGSC